MAAKRHLLISGTGRAGTSVLVELLDAIGLDTGKERLPYYEEARAGYEIELTDPTAPYVVKWPSVDLDAISSSGFDLGRIDGLLLPIRELEQAVLSRKSVSAGSDELKPPGGLEGRWPWQARRAVVDPVYRLLYSAAEHDIPTQLLAYPRFTSDCAYARRTLGRFIGDVDAERFEEAWRQVMDPGKIRTEPLVASPVGDLRIAMTVIRHHWMFDQLRRLGRLGKRVLRPGGR